MRLRSYKNLSLGRGTRKSGGVAPSTINPTYAQTSGGLVGALDFTGTANRTVFQSATSAFNTGAWVGKITGTYADILMFQGGSQPAGMVEVSIDNGAFSAAPVVGGRYVLFTGLPQATRLVVVRINSAYGSSASMPNTGVVMTVTGAPPSVVVASTMVQSGDTNSNVIATNALVQNPTIPFVATFTPPSTTDTQNATRANNPGLTLRTDATEMFATTRARYVYVSVDGAAPTRYDLGVGNTELRTVNITGLSGLRTYYMWASYSQFGINQFSVGLVGGTGLTNIAAKQRFDQYGDSITEGVPFATSVGETDTFRVAAALGYMGGNYGLAGETVSGLNTRATTILANKTGRSAVGANDVAVIAIGRNNTGGAFSAPVIADYQALVNKLLTAGYRRVICRGILPEGANLWPAENGSISSIVTGFADPRVKYCDPSSWSGIATGDGTHPTDAGYVTLAGYAVAAYPALIV